jgi:segregation and condensation protein A
VIPDEKLDQQSPPAPPESLYVQGTSLGPGICLRLPVFEGPMDLLLYLIRREEVDVFNIPIALITREYLRSLELMRALDLDVGGDFVAMAATLLQIKARMLLPRPAAEGAVEDDPRRDLVERLLEYKAFKESAELFRTWESSASDQFWRGLPELPDEPTPQDALRDVTLFDLLTAFKQAMDRLKSEKPKYNIFLLPETFDQRLQYLREQLQDGRQISFQALAAASDNRMAVILTFLAILELTRIGEIVLGGITEEDFYLQSKPAA